MRASNIPSGTIPDFSRNPKAYKDVSRAVLRAHHEMTPAPIRAIIEDVEQLPVAELAEKYGFRGAFDEDFIVGIPDSIKPYGPIHYTLGGELVDTHLAARDAELPVPTLHDLHKAYATQRAVYRRVLEQYHLGELPAQDEHKRSPIEQVEAALAQQQALGEQVQLISNALDDAITAEERIGISRYLAQKEELRTLADSWNLYARSPSPEQRVRKLVNDVLAPDRMTGKQSLTEEEFRGLIEGIALRFTSTMHPTVFQNRFMIEQSQRIGDLFDEVRHGRLDEAGFMDALQEPLHTLWENWQHNPITPLEKVTPEYESALDAALAVRIGDGLAEAIDLLNNALVEVLGDDAPQLDYRQVQQAVWSGGWDTDGRPSESAASLHNAARDADLHQSILGRRIGEYRQNSRVHADLISALMEVAQRENAPAAELISTFLQTRNAAYYHELSPEDKIELLEQTMASEDWVLIPGEETNLRNYLEGTHTLDARTGETRLLSEEEIEVLARTVERLRQLKKEIEARPGVNTADTFIIANATDPHVKGGPSEDISDLHEAYLLMQETGLAEIARVQTHEGRQLQALRTDLEVVPLLESDSAFRHGQMNFHRLSEFPLFISMQEAQADLCVQHGRCPDEGEIKPRQTVMLGFSDGAVSSGVFSSRYSIRTIKAQLSEYLTYDGRPGMESGRAGPGNDKASAIATTDPSLAWIPNYRVTLHQGFAAVHDAQMHIHTERSLMTAVDALIRRPHTAKNSDMEVEQSASRLLQRLSDRAAEIYKEQILEWPEWESFFRESAMKLNDKANSRPLVIGGKIRAITQNLGTQLITTPFLFFGIGQALQEFIHEEKWHISIPDEQDPDKLKRVAGREALEWLYENNPFFRDVMEIAALEGEKADEFIASRFTQRSKEHEPDHTAKVFEVAADLHLTRTIVREIAGEHYPYKMWGFQAMGAYSRVADGLWTMFRQAHALCQLEDPEALEQLQRRNPERDAEADLAHIAALNLHEIHAAFQAGLVLGRPPLALDQREPARKPGMSLA